MPRPLACPPKLVLPPALDLDSLPQQITAPTAAEIHTHYYGPMSPRTPRERWPELEWRLVNGRYVTSTRGFIAASQRRFDAAPVVRGGCGPSVEEHSR
jgi:hypothetical protein